MKTLLMAALVALAAGLVFIRFAPSDPRDWHVDPLAATMPDGNGWLVRTQGGNAPAPVVQAAPEAVLAALDAIAVATPRTIRVAGSVAEGRITYVTRSRLMGYPDYTTVTVQEGTEGNAVILYARQRFGGFDHGVNRARVEAWLTALGHPLGAPIGAAPGT
jgi:uncharacterized protein (DUF1499 family)